MGDGKVVSNWIQQDVMRYLGEHAITIDQYPVGAESFAELLQAVNVGKLTTSRGREVLSCMLENGLSAEAGMAFLGIADVDSEEIETLCKELLLANPQVVEDLKAGKQKAVGALIGQAKRKNPNVAAERGEGNLFADGTRHVESPMDGSIITLTTDFGNGSPYIAAMKGAIFAINPDSHDCGFNALRTRSERATSGNRPDDIDTAFPPGDDSRGRGRSRRRDRTVSSLCFDRRVLVFLAPDNGVLDALARVE